MRNPINQTSRVHQKHPQKQREHRRTCAPLSVGSAAATWLPGETAHFSDWAAASERARFELYEAVSQFRTGKHASSIKGSDLVDEARRIWHYSWERAFPVGFWEATEKLDQTGTADVDPIIAFIEADLRFFRSGYIKASALVRIKRCALTPTQKIRLQDVVLKAVDKGYCREFRYYCRLARAIQTPAFLECLQERIDGMDGDRAVRARWVMEVCAQK